MPGSRARPIKAALRFRRAIVGQLREFPISAGSGYVLLQPCVRRRSTARKAPGDMPIGGMGAISQAMAKAAAERGVEIRVASPVREVLVEGRPARWGVVTEKRRGRSGARQRRIQLESEASCTGRSSIPWPFHRIFRERIAHWRLADPARSA